MKFLSRIITIASFLILAAASVVTAQIRSATIHGWEISGIPEADSAGNNVTWDFTTAEVVGKISGGYMASGDTLIMEALPHVRSDYAISGGSVRLIAVEGRRWRCSLDSILLGQNASDSLKGILGIDLSQRLSVEGVACQTLSNGHRAITAPGDTLTDVSVVEMTFRGVMITTDSVRMQAHASKRYWLSAATRCPIAIETSASIEGCISECRAYLFPPGENASVAEGMPSTRIFRAADFGPAPVYGLKHYGETDRGDSRHAPVGLGDGNADITVSDNEIEITVAPEAAPAEVVLCDIAGRVIEAHAGVAVSIPTSALPPGEYLVSVSGVGWRITEKITLR